MHKFIPSNPEIQLFPSGLILLAHNLGFEINIQDAINILAQYGPLTVKMTSDKFPEGAIDAATIKEAIEKYLADPKARVQ